MRIHRLHLLVPWLALLLTIQASGQIIDRTPEGLIRFLTDQSRRPEAAALGIGGCGIDQQGQEDQEAVSLLVALGDAARLKIELFLEGLDSSNLNPPRNVSRLLFAYSRIAGPAAFPFLWRLHGGNIPSLDRALDNSIALSLGLTSYVSNSREPGLVVLCREQQPRDALDQLLRSWQRGNREWLESALGPNARAGLTAALEDAEARPRTSELTAVGYRFAIDDPWSEPEWMLEDYRDISAENPEITTQFTSHAGRDCGERKIRFTRVAKGSPPAYLTYLVDNADIMDLLRFLGSCASLW